MYAAAGKKGGVGGVSQSVAKEFVAADSPGKLPETTSKRRAAKLYGKKKD